MNQRFPRRRSRPIGRYRGLIIALVFAFIVSISTLVAFYTDLLWYQEVGFQDVFWKILRSKFLLALIFGSGFFVLCLANLLIVTKIMPTFLTGGPDPLDQYRKLVTPYRRRIIYGISLLLGVLFALGVSQQWERFVLATNSVPFGTNDPLFGKDISFYVFRLPMLRFAYGWLFSALVVIGLIVAGAHYLTGGIRPLAAAGRVTPQVKAHLSVLIGLIALLKAWGYRLDQYQLLYSTRGQIFGASYTDVNAELPALKLLVVISVIGAVLFLINIRFRGWTLPIVGIGLWFLTSVLAAGVYPAIVQKFQVAPNQIQKERPFIQRTISSTRSAYGLDKVELRDYPSAGGIDAQVLQANRDTLDNIRLFDPALVRDSYSQLQAIRSYYKFRDVDVDRYEIDGTLRQVMLSARELEVVGNIENPTWQNQHLFFTHGYGAVASLTNETAAQGQPRLLLKDIPPQTEDPALRITQGGVYFGEDFADYSVVRTAQRELDYVQEGADKTTRYAGKGGVRSSGLLRRLVFAWKFREPNLVLSGLIGPESRIIYNRQIGDRLNKAAPFMSFDQDPYPVIADGRIVWMADGYTSTGMIPYAERVDFSERRAPVDNELTALAQNRNYIRNSVKATVDAYDGTITFYVWDDKDPIINAWRKAFPALFKDASEMPDTIRDHVRYPEDLFRIQTHVYRLYHVTNPESFLFGEDRWGVPVDPNRQSPRGTTQTRTEQGTTTEDRFRQIAPYNVLMRLPGESDQDFVLILPMNPRNRSNMVSWIAATSDPDDYGRLIDFRFPRRSQVDGVGQIHSRMNQDPTLSSQITLLNQQGSRIKFGNLLVVPMADSLLYVQPIFLQADQNARPELKFVVLATADKIAVGRNLEEALESLATGASALPPAQQGETPPTGPVSGEEAARQALEHLTKADEAARRGDWATYGREQELAKEALRRAAGQNSPSPSPSP